MTASPISVHKYNVGHMANVAQRNAKRACKSIPICLSFTCILVQSIYLTISPLLYLREIELSAPVARRGIRQFFFPQWSFSGLKFVLAFLLWVLDKNQRRIQHGFKFRLTKIHCDVQIFQFKLF